MRLRRNNGRCAAALLLAGCIALSGCSGTDIGGTTGEAFDSYIEELFLEDVASDALTLHYTLAYPGNYGITDYDVTLGNYSVEDFKESYAAMEETLKELRGFDEEKLTEEQNLTRDILIDSIETDLSVKDLTLYHEILGPTTGYQAQLPVVLAEYTFRTERDIEDYLVLAGQIDDLFAEIVAFEQEKSKAGLFMPDYAVDAVIDQCEEFIADPGNNYMIEIFDDKIDAFEGLTDEQRASYKEKNRTIITMEVVEGYEKLIDGLTALKGTGTNELGLCYYEDGREYYEYLVRTATGCDDSIEELLARTDNFISESTDEIYRLVSENPELLYEFSDYEFPITEPDEIMEDLTSKVSKDFPEPPEVNYTIKYVHPSLQEHLSPAFYLATPVDDIENNVIYINEKYLGEDSMTDLYTTLAHEGYPGHLYQNCYTGSCELPLVRSLLSYPGYSEGWATYVEQYSYGISGLDTDVAKLASLNNAASLALYAYLDMSIHYRGWDREEVAEYLDDYGISDAEVADEIFETLISDPANYLSYFIGYQEFKRLRAEAKDWLGEAFVLKEFHQFLLETGPAPFYIIEDYMQDWAKEQG
ncbi:MAG: DUF885 domain-containing protein [Roseburia sp.]|nr:DUF885 domain-containing protein [Roseburia sp.]